MPECPRCGHSTQGEARLCSRCGAELDFGVDSPTEITSSPPPRSNRSAGEIPGERSRTPSSVLPGEDPRFAPGMVLANRYRIIGRLGRGGMGDVYRADDLKLGQSVALKFLPEAVSGDPERLRRFLAEVRIARQISHANVCRVYDVVEEGGDHFLSMEYIDGEDLTSLLRRIGKLPSDKALELARQICAGLAAAHDRGVLHRDLKPSNIMIDGRGIARIADFGLAGTVDTIQGAEIRAGTPGYMAPEQLRGEEVSTRSDIYALGLVLFEMFTGKRALQGRTLTEMLREQTALPDRTSAELAGLDPAVEQVIRRCLQNDPARRPGSALAVAAALPGGDPVAAALAAGELPSPEMVASLGDQTRMPRGLAVACLLATSIALIGAMFLADRTRVFTLSGPIKAPQVLEERAKEIVDEFGSWRAPRDRVWGFNYDPTLIYWIREADTRSTRWDSLAFTPQALEFWYRQSPRPLVAHNQVGQVHPTDPPNVVPGMVTVGLTPQGQLRSYSSVPPRSVEADSAQHAVDWPGVFRLAGLEIDDFVEGEPASIPPVFADSRRVWDGRYPGRDIALRVEAATLQGQLVHLRLFVPWQQQDRDEERSSGGFGQVVATSLFITVLAGSVLVAYRNLKAGRGDRKGATRLAIVILVLLVLRFLAGAHHVPSLQTEWNLLVFSIGLGLFIGGLTFVMYLTLEPYARQHWPELLISWSRALHGRIRDARVGRDALIGMTAGACLTVLAPMIFVISRELGHTPGTPGEIDLLSLRSGLGAVGVLLERLVNCFWIPMTLVLCLLFLKWILRSSRWAVVVAFAACLTFVGLGNSSIVPWITASVTMATLLTLLLRFGLVSVIGYFFVSSVLSSFPITTHLSSWYGPTGLFGILSILATTAYAFRLATRGPGY